MEIIEYDIYEDSVWLQLIEPYWDYLISEGILIDRKL